jgi:chemotaxis protein MotB
MKSEFNQGQGGHGGSSSERWLLTYADLITLLMVFFIVLFAMSELDKKKFEEVAQRLSEAFGGTPRLSVLSGGGPGLVAMAAPSVSGQASPPDPLTVLGQELESWSLKSDRFSVRMAERGLIISLVGSAAFDSGSADLRPEYIPVLEAIAIQLRSTPFDIAVEGFTDDDPIRTAEFPSNWYLSTARANMVRDYLEHGGVSGERMMVVGYGEQRPAWSNQTPDGKARNRRVDVVVLRDRRILDPGQEFKSE